MSAVSIEGCAEELYSDKLQCGTGPCPASAHGVGTGASPSARYSSCSHPAGNVRCRFRNAQLSYFSSDSSFYMGLATIWI